jgi:hypothetical protein
MKPDLYDLEPGDIRRIAGLADGVYVQTVDDYLLGRRHTRAKQRRLIEGALRELGWAHLIRKD